MFRLPGSRRLSRRSRTVSAVIGIAGVLWMVWMAVFQGAMPPRPKGVVTPPEERLSFATLAPDEEIVVLVTAFQREPVELRFRRDGVETRVIVSAVRWSDVDRAWKMMRVLSVRTLSAVEAAGLDAVAAHLRTRQSPEMPHAATYAIEHRRFDLTLSREKLFESRLASERTEASRAARDEAATPITPAVTAARDGVSAAEFEKWVTFEMLARDAANDDATR